VLASCGNKYYGTNCIYAVPTSLLTAPGLRTIQFLLTKGLHFYTFQCRTHTHAHYERVLEHISYHFRSSETQCVQQEVWRANSKTTGNYVMDILSQNTLLSQHSINQVAYL
jgi:hypothetical protein